MSIVSLAESFDQMHALNNGKCKCPPKKILNVAMSLPCSKDFPANCSLQIRSEIFNVDGIDAKDDPDDEGDNDDDDEDDTETGFEPANLGRHKGPQRKHHRHKNKHDDHQKYLKHKHKKHDHSGHPYSGLCVATGDICGSSLVGCDFDHNTLQEGPDPNCGFDTYTCIGNWQFCSDQFPKSCSLKKNTVYKCSNKTPVKSQSCEAETTCVAVTDGAFCENSNCTCNSDLLTCGGSLALACRYDAASLFTCVKGEKPTFFSTCDLGQCHGSAFASIINDKCSSSSNFTTNKCDNITQRSKGYLTYVNQFFKTIFSQVSLGFVANPLLDAIQFMLNGFLNATNIDITGIANMVAEMLYLLQVIAPSTIQPQLVTLIDKISVIQTMVQECTSVKDCLSPISFIVSVMKVPAGLVDGVRSVASRILLDVSLRKHYSKHATLDDACLELKRKDTN
ncbi:hypothetical protein BGZ59_009190 [Podila verticillata]|nr:hypothetical protein BGZ59_009190 [Podila verticillata]